MKISDLTLKQKITQMFITGFSGTDYSENKYFIQLLNQGLGGVIYFTQNISDKEQIKNLINKINRNSLIPIFHSIDQEGGRVERTENIHKGKKYLSAKYAFDKGELFLRNQTEEIALELNNYGFNMNFAPVLDVNTNKNNPIIGERAFSENSDEVIKAAKIVIDEYNKHNIVPVGKHFPGHGAASADSHKTLPVIDLSKEDLYKNHIRPFQESIKQGIPAIMAAHVLYPSLNNSECPASVSEKIINNILIKELGFDGIIITDDMEMNGIKSYSRLEACIKAINAGISMFIFRDTTEEIYNLINNIEESVNKGLINSEKIDSALEKIFKIKYQYGIIK